MPLSDSLVAYYSFEEASGTRVDATGRGNDLTPRNTPGNATGIQANALALDGVNQDAARADTADLSIGTRDYEICFWMYPTSVTGTALIVCKDNSSTQREYVIRRNGTKMEAYCWSGGTLSSVIQNTTALSVNTWYFVNGYFTSATKKWALRVNDANEVSTTVSTTAIDDGTAQLTIGSFNQTGNQFAGRLDETGFWARNLTSAERTDLYNSGAGRDYAYITAAGGAALGTLRTWSRLWGG